MDSQPGDEMEDGTAKSESDDDSIYLSGPGTYAGARIDGGRERERAGERTEIERERRGSRVGAKMFDTREARNPEQMRGVLDTIGWYVLDSLFLQLPARASRISIVVFSFCVLCLCWSGWGGLYNPPGASFGLSGRFPFLLYTLVMLLLPSALNRTSRLIYLSLPVPCLPSFSPLRCYRCPRKTWFWSISSNQLTYYRDRVFCAGHRSFDDSSG